MTEYPHCKETSMALGKAKFAMDRIMAAIEQCAPRASWGREAREALEKLAGEAQAPSAKLDAERARNMRLVDARREATKDLTGKAARALFALQGEIEAAKRGVKSAEADAATRAEKLRQAGVSAEKIRAAEEPFDPAPRLERIAALEAEHEAADAYPKDDPPCRPEPPDGTRIGPAMPEAA
jgi:hypothetical protein